jgi:hypothetical protein
MPSAPPTCWAVLNTPEITPASASVAPAMPRAVTAGRVSPPPTPKTSSAGSSQATYPACGGTWLSSARAAVIMTSPANSTARAPNRPTSRADRPSDTAAIVAAVGNKPSPAAAGR